MIVADDDALLRSLVEFKLKARGFRVLAAGDGIEALATIEREQPDLVVLDAMMPGADVALQQPSCMASSSAWVR